MTSKDELDQAIARTEVELKIKVCDYFNLLCEKRKREEAMKELWSVYNTPIESRLFYAAESARVNLKDFLNEINLFGEYNASIQKAPSEG